MKSFLKLLFFIIFVCYFGYGYLVPDDSSTVPLAPAQQNQNPGVAEPHSDAALQATVTGMENTVWPFIKANSNAVPLSDSLTTNNIVLIFDGSGSMKKSGCSGTQSKIAVAKQAVIEWSDTVPDDANLGLIVFDHNGFSIRLPLGQQNREQFRSEIDKVAADYKTPLTKAINTAYMMLTEQGQKQLGYGDYSIVVVTDGAADDVMALRDSVDYVLSKSPIMISTIGFCIDSSHTLNSQGRTSYKAANNPEELRQGLKEVLAESESFDIAGFE